MRKLLAFIFLAGALVLAADNYQNSFNAWLSDGNIEVADSILKVWSREAPADPELFPARFNLLLNRARNEMLVLSGEPAQKEGEWTLTDTSGNSTGFLHSEVTWRDSLVDKALMEIDRGIAAYPDRIDFRLGKAAAATMAGRWDVAVKAVDDLLDRDAVNGGAWFGAGNVEQANADTLLADAVFERLNDIYGSEEREAVDAALPLATKAARRFGHDVRIINLAGGMNYGVGNDEAALSYFEEASRIAPSDPIPLTNIAYIQNQRGDTAKALETYRKIENGNFDDESREFARRKIAEITAPVEEMKEYPYFFRYLPQIASQVPSPAEFMDVERFNSSIPAYNKLRSPFADSDIKAEAVVQKDGVPQVVVWTFPMPREIPMCRYMAFVADNEGGCKVFTLEKSLENYWVVGTMSGKAHSNFGEIPYPDNATAFVAALRQKHLVD